MYPLHRASSHLPKPPSHSSTGANPHKPSPPQAAASSPDATAAGAVLDNLPRSSRRGGADAAGFGTPAAAASSKPALRQRIDHKFRSLAHALSIGRSTDTKERHLLEKTLQQRAGQVWHLPAGPLQAALVVRFGADGRGVTVDDADLSESVQVDAAKVVVQRDGLALQADTPQARETLQRIVAATQRIDRLTADELIHQTAQCTPDTAQTIAGALAERLGVNGVEPLMPTAAVLEMLQTDAWSKAANRSRLDLSTLLQAVGKLSAPQHRRNLEQALERAAQDHAIHTSRLATLRQQPATQKCIRDIVDRFAKSGPPPTPAAAARRLVPLIDLWAARSDTDPAALTRMAALLVRNLVAENALDPAHAASMQRALPRLGEYAAVVRTVLESAQADGRGPYCAWHAMDIARIAVDPGRLALTLDDPEKFDRFLAVSAEGTYPKEYLPGLHRQVGKTVEALGKAGFIEAPLAARLRARQSQIVDSFRARNADPAHAKVMYILPELAASPSDD